jgi:hypothetical protein
MWWNFIVLCVKTVCKNIRKTATSSYHQVFFNFNTPISISFWHYCQLIILWWWIFNWMDVLYISCKYRSSRPLIIYPILSTSDSESLKLKTEAFGCLIEVKWAVVKRRTFVLSILYFLISEYFLHVYLPFTTNSWGQTCCIPSLLGYVFL